jgi:PAS domain S-box-containing protein
MEELLMDRNPAYQELEQRVKELEKEGIERKQAEDALRVSKERYRNLVESARDVIYTLSEEGTFTSLNPAFESITGWSRKEWIGKPLESIVHPDDWPGELEFLELMLRGETPPTHEARVRASSGEYLVVESMVTPRFQRGKFVGVLGVARDITERKRVEEALRQSEEKYRDLVENMSEVIYATDNKGMITYVSPAIESFMGYGPSEIMGRPFTEFIYEEDLPRMKKRFNEVLSGNLKESEYRVLNKSGEIRSILVSSKPTVMKNGVSGVRGVLTNITERKQAEKALRESEQRFRILFDFAPDAYYLNDLKGNFIDGNRVAEELTGYRKEELIGKNSLKLALLPPSEIPKAAAALAKNVRGKPTGPDEFILNRKDGTQVTVEITTLPVKIEGQTVVLGIARDITKRKETEQALIEREKELEIKSSNLEETNAALKVLLKRRDEDKTELEEKVLLNVKELAQPYLEKLKMSGLDERQKVYAEILKANLNDIISPFSRMLSSRQFNLSPTEIQVANLVKEGKTNKEIAELLISSPRTIAFHRENIRKKLDLKNKRINLQNHLQSLP